MAVVTRDVFRFGFLLKFPLIIIWKKFKGSFMNKYDNALVKSEKCPAWHIKKDSNLIDKTQTILFWLKQFFCLLEPITLVRQIWYQSLSLCFFFPTNYNLLIYFHFFGKQCLFKLVDYLKICRTLDWITPGPTSFSKYVIILFSECSIESQKLCDKRYKPSFPSVQNMCL